MRELILLLPENGTFHYWIGYAKDRNTWESMIANLGKEKFRQYYQEHTTNDKNNRSRHQYPPSPLRARENNTITPSPISYDRIFLLTTKSEALQILKLQKSATSREIIYQFRILARKFHPDK